MRPVVHRLLQQPMQLIVQVVSLMRWWWWGRRRMKVEGWEHRSAAVTVPLEEMDVGRGGEALWCCQGVLL
jgi:hypothetical protein